MDKFLGERFPFFLKKEKFGSSWLKLKYRFLPSFQQAEKERMKNELFPVLDWKLWFTWRRAWLAGLKPFNAFCGTGLRIFYFLAPKVTRFWGGTRYGLVGFITLQDMRKMVRVTWVSSHKIVRGYPVQTRNGVMRGNAVVVGVMVYLFIVFHALGFS